MPLLIDLIRAVPDTPDYPPEAAQLSIAAITSDSRQAVPGSLFVAIRGGIVDGSSFIAQAKEKGAIAVLCDKQSHVDAAGMAVIQSSNPRAALAHMAARFYGQQPEHMAAVTGTDGKTSTCDFFRQFWHGMKQSSASIGTLGILSGDGELLYPGSHTTPDSVKLHQILADMHSNGINYAGMEASSHGLDQHRLDGVKLEAAAFTNLTRDHLDYHKTEEAYFAAKTRLFTDLLPEGKTAVLNQDDAKFDTLKAICEGRKHRIIGFGKTGGEFWLKHIDPQPHGQHAEVELFGKPHTLRVPLVGGFQILNILTTLGLVIGTGGDLEKALSIVPKLRGVPGRLEQVVQLGNGSAVFIDYAHTPAALANILKTLRPHTKRKLFVVFGCGGDRDAGKRPQMGRVASELADQIIVTDDNPRSEDPALIRRSILEASPRAKEVADRAEAIYVALEALRPGDVLVVAGKGHEKTQIMGNKTIPFDDAEVARKAAAELRLTA